MRPIFILSSNITRVPQIANTPPFSTARRNIHQRPQLSRRTGLGLSVNPARRLSLGAFDDRLRRIQPPAAGTMGRYTARFGEITDPARRDAENGCGLRGVDKVISRMAGANGSGLHAGLTF